MGDAWAHRIQRRQPGGPAVYDDIMATRKSDWINNFWKAIAHDPATLKRTWEDIKQIMAPGALDPVTKEMVYLAVSVSNQCGYCIASHTVGARNKGMTDAMFKELMAVVEWRTKPTAWWRDTRWRSTTSSSLGEHMAHEFSTSYLRDSLSLFRYYKKLTERAMEQVTDEQLFAVLDGEMNCIAIIVKHLVGNMRSRWTDFLVSDGESRTASATQSLRTRPQPGLS